MPTRKAEVLHLDTNNPRLPEHVRGEPVGTVLRYLYEHEDLDKLAESMLRNGLFEHEPVLAVEGDPGAAGGYSVVEGNRRLATITLLLQLPVAVKEDLAFVLEEPPTSAQLERLREVPCVVVKDAALLESLIGFRHIGGVRTWSPEAKARYVYSAAHKSHEAGESRPFAAVASRIGSTPQSVRYNYIALATLLLAKKDGHDISFVHKSRFGVWSRCMNSADIRQYIGLGDAREYSEVRDQLLAVRLPQLREVLSDLEPAEGKATALLADSRDVTDFASVLGHKRARKILRKSQDLKLAMTVIEQASFGVRIANIAKRVELLRNEAEQFDEIEADALPPAKLLKRQSSSLASTVQELVPS